MVMEEKSFIIFLDDYVLPVSFKDIKEATRNDKMLQTVIIYMKNGWPRNIKCKIIKPYHNCKTDLEVVDGCILRGHRIVIPLRFRERMLTELHKGYLGIVKTKSNARSRMWWPGIDQDIERCVATCGTCSALRPASPRAPAPWLPAVQQWERVHIDYMQVGQRVFLVLVDAYSKWLECHQMVNGLSTKSLIVKLKLILACL